MCSFHVGRQHESSLPPQDVVREAENNSVPPLAWPHVFPFQEVAPDLVADCPLAKQITPPEITTWKPENDGFPKGIFGFWGLRFKRFHVNKFRGCTFFFPGIDRSKFLSASIAGGQFLHMHTLQYSDTRKVPIVESTGVVPNIYNHNVCNILSYDINLSDLQYRYIFDIYNAWLYMEYSKVREIITFIKQRFGNFPRLPRCSILALVELESAAEHK